MRYVLFSLGFFGIHLVAYFVAGAVNLRVTKDLYGGEGALFGSFLRDMSDPKQQALVNRRLLPAQFVRAILMSVVLYPILEPLAEMSYGLRVALLGGLMLVYTDVAAATPFSNTVEGVVYMQPRFVRRDVFWKIQSEALLYSVLFATAAAWILF